jgi:hypothetical protein
MDPPGGPTAFQRTIRGDRSRVRAYAVLAAAVLLVGVGLLASLTADGTSQVSPLAPASGPVALVSPSPTPRPTATPTPVPTPVPTLAPVAAPATATPLSPTGVLVADAGAQGYGGLVPDADGTVWTTHAGGVLDIDPATGHGREWTLADDPAFATAYPAPAPRAGVWLEGPDAIRLFDGERFRMVIETPAPVLSIVEGSDGSLWAATDRYGLIHWADGTWTSEPTGRTGRGVANVVVDADGRVWTADYDRSPGGPEISRGISVWNGSSWANFSLASLGLPKLSASTPSLFASGDGSVWVFAQGRLALFRAGSWTDHDVADLGVVGEPIAVGDDGRLWFAAQDCESSCGVRIQVYDGSAVTTYDHSDGLPGPDEIGDPGATVLPGPGYVLASTDAGLYRLADGAWHPLAVSTPSRSPSSASSIQGRVTSIAAMSHTEAWATSSSDAGPGSEGGGIWRFDGTSWQRQKLPVKGTVGNVVVAADGALWVATDSGPLVRRGGAWIDLGDTVAKVVPRPLDDGTLCGGAVYDDGNGAVEYAGARSSNRLVALRPVGRSWVASLQAAPATNACATAMRATADGTMWLLQRGWGSVLARLTDGSWEIVSVPTAGRPGEQVRGDPTAIAVDRDGSLWVAVFSTSPTTFEGHADLLQWVDGRFVLRSGAEGMGYIQALAPLSDGSLIAVGDGIARFDGRQWHQLWRGLWLGDVSIAPDGAVWVAGANVYKLPPWLP